MQIERGAFLLSVASLSAGAAGGYVASEKDVVPHMAGSSHVAASKTEVSSAPAAVPAVTAAAPAASVMPATPAPVCDDSVGEPGACPQMPAPTEEGVGCGGFATTRCNDFKQTMKPRVAQAAVACLNKLSGAERCDPKRVELCGHLALMNACDDLPASAAVASMCEKIVQTCGASPLAPSQNECRLAMVGLKEVGRDAMFDCAKKHCFDKGVLGCEAVTAPKP